MKRRARKTNPNQAEDQWLHATKGWRLVSVRRSKAQMITNLVKAGKLALSSVAMREFKL